MYPRFQADLFKRLADEAGVSEDVRVTAERVLRCQSKVDGPGELPDRPKESIGYDVKKLLQLSGLMRGYYAAVRVDTGSPPGAFEDSWKSSAL